jgi:4-hydroxy-tetrahydrodipicolinate reductase
MSHRVIQWSTGHVGTCALHGIIQHPDLELVGLWVHSESKAGRDAGELCGLPPAGVAATNDADALLALDADVVSYTATADLRPWEAVEDICRILESGKNVVSSSLVQLLHPPKADQTMVDRLEAACKTGGTSMFTSGIDPGFANDLLPIVLSGFCERIDHIRIQEILNYATYDQPEVLFETMGFGKPLDNTPLLLFPGALSYAWGGVIHMIGDALDVDVTEIRERHEKASLDHDVDIELGTVGAGTMSGLRFEVAGVVGGEERIVVEHVTRVHDDVAPDWPKGHGQGYYRIELTGSPSVNVDLELVGEDGDHNTGGVLGTAMRIVNAIPDVVAAPPGMLSTLDLPVTPGRHLMPQ